MGLLIAVQFQFEVLLFFFFFLSSACSSASSCDFFPVLFGLVFVFFCVCFFVFLIVFDFNFISVFVFLLVFEFVLVLVRLCLLLFSTNRFTADVRLPSWQSASHPPPGTFSRGAES